MLTSFQYSLALSVMIAGVALTTLPFCKPDNTRVRAALFGVCFVLLWRYIAWRFTETIPPLSLDAEAISAFIFACLETLSAVSATFAFVMLSRTKDRKAEATKNAGWWKPGPPPLVDVFIATYNEERSILERTLGGALGIDYPALRIWVLDDGRRDWLKAMCDRKNIGYLTRPDNSHAKAGNLNHALRHVAGLDRQPDFVAVFDADFVAHANIIHRMMALFHKSDVGIVQTPQHFFNADPIQMNLLIARAWPDEQRFFFDHMLPAKDAWGVAFCCGTSSMLRYNALQEIGGFATESVTEDYLVSLKMKQKGWRTVYLNERLSDGLAPEGMREYVTQRSRWCLGFMQIFRGEMGPFRRNNLAFSDRIGLIDTFLYWTSTFTFRLAALAAPLLYWWFGICVVRADAIEVVQYFVPYYLSVMIAYGWIARRQILPLLTDVSQLLAALEINRAILAGLFKPQGQPFKVTAKGGERTKRIIHWTKFRRFGLLAALTVGGIAYGMVSDYAPGGQAGDGECIVLLWTYYNLAVLLLTMAVCIELPRYRRDERFLSHEPIGVETSKGLRALRLIDISAGGARIHGVPDTSIGNEVIVHMGNVGAIPAQVVTTGKGYFSLKFLDDELLRERLFRKLYSRHYQGNPHVADLKGIMRGLLVRAMR